MRQITTPLLTGYFSETEPPVETAMEIHACFIGKGEKLHLVEVPIREDGQRVHVANAVCFKGTNTVGTQPYSPLHILPNDTYEITCKHCAAKLNDLLDQRVRYLEQQKVVKTVQDRPLEILREQSDYIILVDQAGVLNNE